MKMSRIKNEILKLKLYQAEEIKHYEEGSLVLQNCFRLCLALIEFMLAIT